MAVKTRDEAIRDCLGSGAPAADCERLIAEHSVHGVYCDGMIVITADGKRCVTDELRARVLRAGEASPLGPSVSSSTAAAAQGPSASPWIVALGIIAILGLGALVLRRSAH